VTKPNPENCKNCTSKCAYDWTVYNFSTQYNTEQKVSYDETLRQLSAAMHSVGY